mmetsp:Transcript_50282/g.58084  ORF Transcript_50282/g.58084 Transcript_50282/m.58084 type:complete len:420 (+) Transcript_50282:68-1327(+)
MGTVASLLVKATACFAVCGYATHRLLESAFNNDTTANKAIRISLTTLASLGGLTYYLRVWVQDYYFDRSYKEKPSSSSSSPCRDLTGHTAVVTGGTVNGLGYAAAELLYQQGANVIITTRSIEKGETAIAKLTKKEPQSSSLSRASFVVCDFLSESSIRKCSTKIIKSTNGRIDFLVLNAGISGQGGASSTVAAKVWMTNHLGPFLFANELMPALIRTAKENQSQQPRVVWVSSGAHKKADIDWDNPFQPGSSVGRDGDGDGDGDGNSKSTPSSSISSYGQSKLANIMHMREYQKRIRQKINSDAADVKCFAVTPGAVWTNIMPPTPLLYPLFWFILRSPTIGAQVIKMACLDNNILKGGEYLSNCYVKATEGENGCSNDEIQWNKLWELSSKQIEENEYKKFSSSADDEDDGSTKKTQ